MVQWAAHVASGEPWIVVMPVIGDSTNPGGEPQKIIGYAAFQIMDVQGVTGSPAKSITLKHIPGILPGGAGGGGAYFGLWSLEPKLVQVK